MTPGEFVDALDAALAEGPRGGRKVIIDLTAPRVMGHVGKPRGSNARGAPIYGYTRNQCKDMRKAIMDAAREDYENYGSGEPLP